MRRQKCHLGVIKTLNNFNFVTMLSSKTLDNFSVVTMPL